MKCEICGKEAGSLFKVRHRERGRAKICEECLREEKDGLLTSSGCSCC
jgi:ribosome-binding protein aMBF1 (putative translation factor)